MAKVKGKVLSDFSGNAPLSRSWNDGERCLNPWNGKCESAEIALYIIYKGEKIPICRKCWGIISQKDIVWEVY